MWVKRWTARLVTIRSNVPSLELHSGSLRSCSNTLTDRSRKKLFFVSLSIVGEISIPTPSILGRNILVIFSNRPFPVPRPNTRLTLIGIWSSKTASSILWGMTSTIFNYAVTCWILDHSSLDEHNRSWLCSIWFDVAVVVVVVVVVLTHSLSSLDDRFEVNIR
jgi:hypothetical protein